MAERTCRIEECEAPHYCRGMCQSHYDRWRHEVGVQRCSLDGCERPLKGYGYCQLHYRRWKHHDDPLWQPPSVVERFWAKVDIREPDES